MRFGDPAFGVGLSGALRSRRRPYRSFRNYALFERGAEVETADVWLGGEATVPLVAERDIRIPLPRASRRELVVSVVCEGPVPALIDKGTEIAKLVIAAPDFETVEVSLVSGADVGRGDLPHAMGSGAVEAGTRMGGARCGSDRNGPDSDRFDLSRFGGFPGVRSSPASISTATCYAGNVGHHDAGRRLRIVRRGAWRRAIPLVFSVNIRIRCFRNEDVGFREGTR